MLSDDALHLDRRNHVGQTIRTHEHSGVRLETGREQLDEIIVCRPVRPAADVAKDFVSPRVTHRLHFGQLAAIFAIANRRVVVRELGDAARRKLVEPAVADVADDERGIADHGERQHAGHALHVRLERRSFQDALVGEQNRVAHTIVGRRIVDAHPAPHGVGRETGRDVAGGMTADAVNHQHEPGLRIQLVAVFVLLARTAGMTAGGRRESRRPERKGSCRKQASGVSHADLLRS
jgi:hypothetical protein